MFKPVTFEVTGDQRLYCAGCEQRVESLLQAVPGVKQVRVRARNQRIDVLFDAALETAAIVARLSTVGYETRVDDATDSAVPLTRSAASPPTAP
jgi:copper chaperone CopZ